MKTDNLESMVREMTLRKEAANCRNEMSRASTKAKKKKWAAKAAIYDDEIRANIVKARDNVTDCAKANCTRAKNVPKSAAHYRILLIKNMQGRKSNEEHCEEWR